MAHRPILVTRPFLPPGGHYQQLVAEIFQRNILTNDGPLLRELEHKLQEYFNHPQLVIVNNGTTALQFALKALPRKGKIITTPFSYVATVSSAVWEGFEPVFADIDHKSFNLCPVSVRSLIDQDTVAILPTHVYGNPCDVEAFEQITADFGIPVIYDAAHTFGVNYKGRPLACYGALSTLSLHATKVFHMAEGGAILCHDAEMLHRLKMYRNFGHNGFFVFDGVGVNGKNSELHAAMGLCIWPYIAHILQRRKELYERYIANLTGSGLTFQHIRPQTEYNCSYMPVLLPTAELTNAVYEKLSSEEIYARRYFYPLLSELDYVKFNDTPIARDVASRVLCLPLYVDLTNDECDRVCERLLANLNLHR